MKTFVPKCNQNPGVLAQRQVDAGLQLEREEKTTPDFTDNRPESIAQRKLADAIRTAPASTGQTPAQMQFIERETLQGKFPVQRGIMEEEEPVQGKFPVQRGIMEEEEPVQGKFPVQRGIMEEEEPVQGKFPVQRGIMEEEEEPIQGKSAVQKVENTTGIPDNVLSRAEQTFNADFSGVRVHPNSSKAPSVGALAYTQGSDIHFAPGQFTPDSAAGQRLLGHELTHVVQQSEGRVQPTTEVNGMPVNDNPALEAEADSMGSKI